MATPMKSILILFLFVEILFFKGVAQNDTIPSNNLLGEISASENKIQKLLPDKILFTQRIFWGEKGLMRNFKSFNLTPEDRQRELKVRRSMLVTHQVMGFLTLGGMVAQGFVGSKLYKGQYNLRETHETLAGAINIGYFTTASLSLFAPPKMLDERKGYSSIKLHKALAIIHLSGMIATNILASELETHPELRPYHRAAAFTTFGAFAASMIVIKF
jgi:hypothetical protein